MSTAPTASDVTRVYATLDDIMPLIAPHTISAASASGDVLITGGRVAAALLRFSRIIDGRLAGIGVRTPFPDVGGGGNPTAPQLVRDWVAYRTAAEVALWAAGGNAKARKVMQLLALADEICAVSPEGELCGSVKGDSFIQYVHNEVFEVSTLDNPVSEFGQLGSTTRYRLRNPGLICDGTHPLKFVDASNVEIFDSAGRPFSSSNGWYVIDASQSVIQIARRTEIESKASYVNYWFTWRDQSWFVCDDKPFDTGVAHYAP